MTIYKQVQVKCEECGSYNSILEVEGNNYWAKYQEKGCKAISTIYGGAKEEIQRYLYQKSNQHRSIVG